MIDTNFNIHVIDCDYIRKRAACAYLIQEGSEAAFVENNTTKAVPLLLKKLQEVGLQKEQVKYLIVTHVHLDHAGGTSALVKQCPNAQVLAHPKAAPHIINPKRLVDSASEVYGKEAFQEMYGEISPVPQERVRVMQDGEVLSWGKRKLTFVYTKGHANHHFVIYDSHSQGIFSGDSFGLGYPALQMGSFPFLFPSTSPTDFDPDEAMITFDKVAKMQPKSIFLTHFGEWTKVSLGISQLRDGISAMQRILETAVSSQLSDDNLIGICLQGVNEFMKREVDKRDIELSEDDWKMIKMDIRLNAMGIAHTAKKIRKKKNLQPV
ncbi:MAG: MBL fold metallo-hydrolase [Spirochaetota bacterium]